MKKHYILVVLLLLCLASLLTACQNQWVEPEGIKVVYHLEGGEYKNSENNVTQYYVFPEGTKKLIYALGSETLEGTRPKDVVTRGAYILDGWYQTRVENNGVVTYEDEWNFQKDTVTSKGVELYAKWKAPYDYSFMVKYVDENGVDQQLGSYEASEGLMFWDYNGYANSIPNGTPLKGFYSDRECTQLVLEQDASFVHPGGEGDTAISVYVKYIQGRFKIIGNDYISEGQTLAGALQAALISNENIWLLDDVDFQGKFIGNVNYRGTFVGNNHVISNISIFNDNVQKSDFVEDFKNEIVGANVYQMSIFGDCRRAKVSDVTFQNVTAVVNFVTSLQSLQRIYIAPLAISATNSTFTNVTISNFVITTQKLPNDSCTIQTTSQGEYVFVDDGSTFTNVQISYN